MFESLERIVAGREGVALDESDVRVFIQDWVRQRLHTEAIYCVEVRRGRVTLAATSPTVRQALRLLEFDLQTALAAQRLPPFQELVVTQS